MAGLEFMGILQRVLERGGILLESVHGPCDPHMWSCAGPLKG